MLAAFMILLWIAGGSARLDAAGQIVVRLAAWGLLCACIIRGLEGSWRKARPVALIMGAATVLVILQLVPLPPEVWLALPSRDLLAQSAVVVGLPQPWRPLSISPGATLNALGSLVVPWVTLLLAASLTRAQHDLIARLLVGLVLGGCLLGLLQFTGAQFDNPLINEIKGFVSGNFSNRNHFALFVAIGILLILMLDLGRFKGVLPSFPLMILIVPFLLMVVLLTGSRAGLVLSVIATGVGLLSSRKLLGQAFRDLPKKWSLGLSVLLVVALGGLALFGATFDRVEAVDRLALVASEDLRARAFPIVWDITASYFPAGSGFGSFDAAYRIAEPDALLNLLYFNHAHNDWLEIVLDGGLAGIVLLAAALGWWCATSWRLWRSKRDDLRLARCGSAICLLTMIASLTDYPARTPMIMAILTLAALWMADGLVHLGAGGERAGGEARKRAVYAGRS